MDSFKLLIQAKKMWKTVQELWKNKTKSGEKVDGWYNINRFCIALLHLIVPNIFMPTEWKCGIY